MDCLLDFFYGSSAMTSLIYKVARLAHQTFASHPNVHFMDNFNKLKLLTNQIKKSDVCLSTDLISQDRLYNFNPTTEAPVSYMEIFENETITLGIFIVKTGARIPLHDHPGMYGVIRVLHGTVSIQSYSQLKSGLINTSNRSGDKNDRENLILVKKLPPVYATEESECSVLTPEDVNYHEIRAVGGVAAFLDILAPPYDSESRTCHYYREIPRDPISSSRAPAADDDGGEHCVYLEEVSHPPDYWSDSKPYEGPEVDF